MSFTRSNNFQLASCTVSTLTLVLWLGTEGFCQQRTVTTDKPLTATMREYYNIPEATEACVPEECAWWNRLREAGNVLQKKTDEKSKKRFALMFSEGLEKGYRVPLKDRPVQVLLVGQPVYSPLTISRLRMMKINGSTEISVEFRADGSVGDVRLIKGLDKEFDQSVIEAARNNLFLPAVKNGFFITEWQKGEMKFSTHR